jgi:ribosomal protein L37E
MTRADVENGEEINFTDSDVLPCDDVCEECGSSDLDEKGYCADCGWSANESAYACEVRHMTPTERKWERDYWTARSRGFED